MVQVVHDSGYGAMAWAWNAGADALTGKGTGLTDFGQLTAKHISAGALAPASAVAVPSNSANGPATASRVMIGSGPNALVLLVSEDAWQGDARFAVSVDGAQVGSIQTATASHAAGKVQSYAVNGDFGSGSHAVAINFIRLHLAGELRVGLAERVEGSGGLLHRDGQALAQYRPCRHCRRRIRRTCPREVATCAARLPRRGWCAGRRGECNNRG